MKANIYRKEDSVHLLMKEMIDQNYKLTYSINQITLLT